MLTNCYLILFKYKINFILCQRLFTIACLFRFDLISTLRFNTPAFFLKKSLSDFTLIFIYHLIVAFVMRQNKKFKF